MIQSIPLHAWPQLSDQPVQKLSGGLINESYSVGQPPIGALQSLHPIFDARVNDDIDAVTCHLARQGRITPMLVRTGSGATSYTDGDGLVWRMLTWIPGKTYDAIDGPALAAQAGRVVADWHRATADLEHDFAFSRPGAHDTEAHMNLLHRSVDAFPQHPLRGDVARLAEQIASDWASWEGRVDGPERVTHGDLKISNIRFDGSGRAICLLDLDTMGLLSLDIELGDAARSWCNRSGEDQDSSHFDVATFEAAFTAYLREAPLPSEEREALVGGIERICLELASRFAADALRECYFGWDSTRFATRGEHNLVRALGQAALARSVRSQRPALRKVLGLTS